MRTAADYRAELTTLAGRLEREFGAGKIVGEGMSQFLVVTSGVRGIEIYGSDARAVIDAALGDELQGEIEYRSYDLAIAAATRWLCGCALDELRAIGPE